MFRGIRLASLKDAPYAFGSTYEREIAADEADWRTRLGSRAQFVAELAGEDGVAGTAGGITSGDGSAALISMWVRPASRGKGAGDALVEAVLEWARAEGHPAVRLWVTNGNEAAERLYARHGFARTGAVQPVFPDQPRMELEMIREL